MTTFARPPSTRQVKRAGRPPKLKPGKPRVHLSNLMRAYLKRTVDRAMPEYDAVAKGYAKRSDLLARILVEAAKGDEGDLEPLLLEARAELYPAEGMAPG